MSLQLVISGRPQVRTAEVSLPTPPQPHQADARALPLQPHTSAKGKQTNIESFFCQFLIFLSLVLFLSCSYSTTEILWFSVKATVVVLKSLGRAEQSSAWNPWESPVTSWAVPTHQPWIKG